MGGKAGMSGVVHLCDRDARTGPARDMSHLGACTHLAQGHVLLTRPLSSLHSGSRMRNTQLEGTPMNEHAPVSAPTIGADRGSLRLDDGLRVEASGEDLLVLDTTGNVVHRVTGAGTEALRRLTDRDLDGALTPEVASALDDLVAAGIATDGRRLSRRKVMVTGGTAFAAATVTTFALANPAAAATGCSGNVTPTPPGTFTLPGTFGFTTGPGVTTILARAWGGGGGGGGADHHFNGGGGGGGGGAYASATVQVTECTTYQVAVGAGGTGGGVRAGGNDGESSSFGSTLVNAAGGNGGPGGVDNAASGGHGGSATASAGTLRHSGGDGGGAGPTTEGGGGGGGSAGHGGDGSPGEISTTGNAAGGAGGAGTPGGAPGGIGTYDGPGGTGVSPGGGGGGASGYASPGDYGDHDWYDGGDGAPGAVWVGL